MIPVYVVTGFLGSGKSTFIKQLLDRSEWRDVNVLTVQFESGAEKLPDGGDSRENLVIPMRVFESSPDDVAATLSKRIRAGAERLERATDEIWIEWNGVVPYNRLSELLLRPSLSGLCAVMRVIHIADARTIDSLLGKTGNALPEQIASSDFAVVQGAGGAKDLRRARGTLRSVNPGVPVCGAASDRLYSRVYARGESPFSAFFVMAVVAAILYIIAVPFLENYGIPANRTVNIFLGIILQAVPFLLIGVLLSSAIEVFVTRAAIERLFPKNKVAGMLAAVFAGFLLPVCDCASIPIFRSLIRKGVPLHAAVTFMTVSPVINPVVILSTYYAFGGDMSIVAARVILGIAASAVIGLTFAARPPRESVLAGGTPGRLAYGGRAYDYSEPSGTRGGRLGLFLRHAQAEFWDVGKYLVAGTFVSAAFQSAGLRLFAQARGGWGLAASVAVMMAAGFLLSLCSSSDAVVARSLMNQFPTGALMGFLVFGPMMDIKNALMLSSGFTARFIVRLTVTAFIVCFAAVFLWYGRAAVGF
ncbi:MAG: permease [Oscillospiraceae bacterium]|jgi:uncharacterized membrane protein YraQ (UPF0718 family)|nr:permease [Oscillospiraceae bacterium]